jgi:asparaginyl-tRNA synthetase
MLFRRLLSTSSRLRPSIRQILYGGGALPPVSPEHVDIHGWVKSVRRQKRIAFAAISDGSCEEGIQAVFSDPQLAKSCVCEGSVAHLFV